eukprot:TRINITY_DN73471_c0_g1_i1.p1 TRINITY_DN73471_c0_g1~~TRINITY_DN73471_c0_g1_i1.p1  ORF type:complete len:1193 (+),score=136.39 TRINITY_DN73471_c0_g1_i1:74-3580(+)
MYFKAVRLLICFSFWVRCASGATEEANEDTLSPCYTDAPNIDMQPCGKDGVFLRSESFQAALKQLSATQWLGKATLYRLSVPSFQDSDGDGLGDLQGVIQRLPWLRDLGVAGIILSPIFPAPTEGSQDEWADTVNFTDVETRFGGRQALDRLLQSAHDMGIRILLEWIPNHSSDRHPWFQQALQPNIASDVRDMYVWKPNNVSRPNWVSFYGRQVGSSLSTTNGQDYYHAFLPSEPDLNYSNSLVRKAMNDTLRFWLDAGIDGFLVRHAQFLFEAVSGPEAWRDENPMPECLALDQCTDFMLWDQMPHEKTQGMNESHRVVQEWRDIVDSYEQQRLLIGDFSGQSSQHTDAHQWYGSSEAPEFHAVLSTPLRAFTSADDAVNSVMGYLKDLPDYALPTWSLSGPDSHRLASQLHDENFTATLLSLVALLPGLKVMYYGETAVMKDVPVASDRCRDPRCLNNLQGDYNATGRDHCRTPMQWNSSANAGFSNTTTQTYLPIASDYRSSNSQTDIARAVRENVSKAIRVFSGTSVPHSPRLNLSVQEFHGVFLAAFEDPDAVRRQADGPKHNNTMFLVNFKDEPVTISWESLADVIGTRKLDGNTLLRWEVRYSLHTDYIPRALVNKNNPVVLRPKQVLVFSSWIYGTRGIMDVPHWIWFAFQVMMVSVVSLNVLGSLCWWTRRTYKICTAPAVPSYEDGPERYADLPSMAIVVPCFMPNERRIIMDTLNYILDKVLYEFADPLTDPGPEFQSKVSVWCVYNGSNEGTKDIEDKLAEMSGQCHGRFRRKVIVQKVQDSKSKAQNLNFAIQEAKETYMTIYDADHHPDPLSLRTAMRMMLRRGSSDREVDCVQGSTYIRAGGPRCVDNWMRRMIDAEFFVNYFVNFPAMQTIIRSAFFGGSNAVWRTRFLQQREGAGEGFDETRQCEDIDFSVRAQLQAAVIEFCPESRSGELAPEGFRAFYKQRRRWALGWEEVTLKYMNQIRSSSHLSACRKVGLTYMLPLRWPLTLLNAIGLYASMALALWWLIYKHWIVPDRYVSWGAWIDGANTILGILGAINLTCVVLLALYYEMGCSRKIRMAICIILFISILGPLYLVWQGSLMIVSHCMLCKGSEIEWHPTGRGAAPLTSTQTTSAENSMGPASLMSTFGLEDREGDSHVSRPANRSASLSAV